MEIKGKERRREKRNGIHIITIPLFYSIQFIIVMLVIGRMVSEKAGVCFIMLGKAIMMILNDS